MLISALIFLTLAVIAGIFGYKTNNPTLALIAKIIFYFSLMAFLVLFFTFFISSAPPIPADNSKLPL